MIMLTAVVYATVSLTITFHVLMLTLLPRSTRFWKATDYVWILIGSLALASVANKFALEAIKSESGSIDAPLIEYLASIRSEESWRAMKDFDGYSRDTAEAANYSEGSKEQLFHTSRASRFFETARQRLQIIELIRLEHPDVPSIQQARKLCKLLPDRQYSQDAGPSFDRLDRSLKEFETELQKNSEFMKTVTSPAAERMQNILGSFLIPLAIAIRLTKVTAELTGYDKPKVPTTPSSQPTPTTSAGAVPALMVGSGHRFDLSFKMHPHSWELKCEGRNSSCGRTVRTGQPNDPPIPPDSCSASTSPTQPVKADGHDVPATSGSDATQSTVIQPESRPDQNS